MQVTLVSCFAWLLFCTTVQACEVGFRDQLLLVSLARATPTPATERPSDFAGKMVECASLGRFLVVKIDSARVFVLDEAAAFRRWTELGRVFFGPSALPLSAHFATYRATSRYTLWRIYGREAFTPEDFKAMSLGASLLPWSSFKMISAEAYVAALRRQLDPEAAGFLRLLILERLRSTVAAQYQGAHVVNFEVPGIMANEDEAVVKVWFRKLDSPRVESATLRLPINPAMPPYVGYPELD